MGSLSYYLNPPIVLFRYDLVQILLSRIHALLPHNIFADTRIFFTYIIPLILPRLNIIHDIFADIRIFLIYV